MYFMALRISAKDSWRIFRRQIIGRKYQRVKSRASLSDLFWVERLESENISIDQMRGVKGKLSSSSFNNSYKVAIINEAENLNQRRQFF